MSISIFMIKQPQQLLNIPSGGLNIDNVFNPKKHKEMVVIVMGATGTGKSKLSLDLATRFPAEIINSDKIQMYEGLDIITNKITKEEQRGVTHHLLGVASPFLDFSAADFCHMASQTIESILHRDRVPIIVGGSNSYIEALIDNDNSLFRSKYECCFLWVDVSMPMLHSFVSDRVDKMVENGMVKEARKFFDPDSDYSSGIRKAIGVPEFDKYFRCEPYLDEASREKLLQEAICQVKDNTCKLACRQVGNIHRLRNIKGWNLHRLNATEVFRSMNCEEEMEETWNELVSNPSRMIVAQFLDTNVTPLRVPAMRTSIAAATH